MYASFLTVKTLTSGTSGSLQSCVSIIDVFVTRAKLLTASVWYTYLTVMDASLVAKCAGWTVTQDHVFCFADGQSLS
jgi:hypothetical protein